MSLGVGRKERVGFPGGEGGDGDGEADEGVVSVEVVVSSNIEGGESAGLNVISWGASSPTSVGKYEPRACLFERWETRGTMS